ncbi:JNK1/MAPK8-associated membrane protein-like [Argiope bruennichi]|uniref:JNK1/MAPK8-associated membrane protein like n=1 Tax=Argiope bruennichi TaxID=94029 RepID=A0A8T0FQ47_ARGBR|nr:JNK1/MAPK8-associated membrane protein-like [Argiope bruennichi]KAF8793304.1 JNK1/MAPK8-associated membrane protein like [Argiope bruennichi]
MVMDHSTHCPGLYCGRIKINGTWGECGACPRGFRAAANSVCIPCKDVPTFYDWFYLGFMPLLLLVLEWYIIDQTMKRRNFTKDVLSLHICALIENVLSAFSTLLLTEPRGTLNIHACKVKRLSDWYTMLHNPTPNYEKTLRCTQEAVYPLYSMVFIHYSLALLSMLIIRPFVVKKISGGRGKKSIYFTMYLIPVLVVLQATCGGLLYYSFPYIVIILTFISVAAHLAFRLDQSMASLFLTSIQDYRNLVILLGHWLLHAYGIIAITQLTNPVLHSSLLALVPFPTVFYILTSKFTDPSKLHPD